MDSDECRHIAPSADTVTSVGTSPSVDTVPSAGTVPSVGTSPRVPTQRRVSAHRRRDRRQLRGLWTDAAAEQATDGQPRRPADDDEEPARRDQNTVQK